METGKLSFDAIKLRSALSTQRDDVETLLTTADVGVGEYAADLIDNLTDEYDSVIQRKADQYDATIEVYQDHADSLAARLAMVQQGLYNQFYGMEDALAKLQTQRTAIENMTSLLTYNSNSNKR
jgi:flagellar capping protein FliD